MMGPGNVDSDLSDGLEEKDLGASLSFAFHICLTCKITYNVNSDFVNRITFLGYLQL